MADLFPLLHDKATNKIQVKNVICGQDGGRALCITVLLFVSF